MKLLDCGHEPSDHSKLTTGYGTDSDGKTMCYDCCAKKDLEIMQRDKKIILYLSNQIIKINGLIYRHYVSNWPGSLKFPVNHVRKGRHNIARTRYDFWFNVGDKLWHGVQYGDNTQIAHCNQVKG